MPEPHEVTRLLDQLAAGDPTAAERLARVVSGVYGVAARVMRQLLVEHARARARAKRDAGTRVTLDEQLVHDHGAAAGTTSLDLLALDDALERLAAVDERQARVVELRYFGGLTLEEAAEALGVSLATAKRDWTFARAFLRLALDGGLGGR